MKSAVIAGVCLLAFTITTTDAVSKKQDCIPNLDLLACIDGYNANSDTVCTDDCMTALTGYYNNCVPTGADAFRKGYALLCENIGCVPNSDLLACIDGYTTNSETVCTDDCKTALTEYYDDCVSAGGDAFRTGYALLCGCTPNSELQACLDGYTTNSETVCTDDCKTALTEYYDDCVPSGGDAFRTGYALLCTIGGSSATTVGATMFTTVSAVLVAVGN